MPTRRGDVDARHHGNMDHRRETLPTAQPQHGGTRKPLRIIADLDAHASTGVAPRGQKNLGAMRMRTPGRVAPAMEGLVKLMQEYAKKYQMVIVVPIYEEAMTGVYYNTAAVIDADGTYLGKYRKTHIPQVAGFWEKFFFKPGASEYPVFKTRYCNLGVYICYDRHFPEGWRALALNGADYIVNPSATVAGLSEYLWKLEQPASAVANGVYIGAINRIGKEAPWNIGEFYGQSYFVNPRGQIEAIASRDKDELIVHDMNFDMIREVRNTWQFFRDRRPETYGPLTDIG